MSIIREYQLHKTLTPDQLRILGSKQVEATYTPDQWFALLAQLAEYDRIGDAARKTIGRLGCATGVLLAITFFIAVTGFFIPFVLVLLAGIPLLIFYISRKKRDLSDRLRRFTVPLISILKEEMEPGQPLYLKLDFREGTEKEKETSLPTRARHMPGNIKETFYANPWMEGEALLADGSRLQWMITDNIRKRVINKRSASGKSKTKTKYKIKTRFEAQVQLRRTDYALADKSSGTFKGDRVAARAGEKRNVVSLRRAVISTTLDSVPDLNNFLDLVAGAYRRVKPAGDGEK